VRVQRAHFGVAFVGVFDRVVRVHAGGGEPFARPGCACASSSAFGECSRLAPVRIIRVTPASRARCQTASRSRSKLSWVRLAPMSIRFIRAL
jgi:hypothetical protein